MVQDWDKPLAVSIDIFLFNRIMTFDDSNIYKGNMMPRTITKLEKFITCCDVWNHKDEMLLSILVKASVCKTLNMTEVIAVIILLKRAMRVNISYYVWTSFYRPK